MMNHSSQSNSFFTLNDLFKQVLETLVNSKPYKNNWLIPTYGHADLPPLRSVPSQKVNMNGAECSESNGKNNKKILRFLFFELSSNIGVIFSEK